MKKSSGKDGRKRQGFLRVKNICKMTWEEVRLTIAQVNREEKDPKERERYLKLLEGRRNTLNRESMGEIRE